MKNTKITQTATIMITNKHNNLSMNVFKPIKIHKVS